MKSRLKKYSSKTVEEVDPDIKEEVDLSLSNDDVDKILQDSGSGTTFVKYDDLDKSTSILNYLDKRGRMMLLLPVLSDSSGHWVCLWFNKRSKTLNYFDPYGLKPDYWMKHWDAPAAEELTPVLTDMLQQFNNRGGNVLVNTKKYQQYSDKVNTCGRWCAARLLLKDVSQATFDSIMESTGVGLDKSVTLLTKKILGR